MKNAWWLQPSDLKPEQSAVISLPVGASQLVLGPPGSGKTNILLLRASYLARAGHPNVLILLFTKTLQEYVLNGGVEYGFHRSKVLTSTKWYWDFLREYGVQITPPEKFTEQRTYLVETIKDLIETRNLRNLYEAILLDEAQDYWPAEIEIFRRLGKTLFAVADSRQKIYDGPDPLDALRAAVVSPATELRYHYRNGPEICKVADAIAKDSDWYDPLEPTCNYDTKAWGPCLVQYVVCSTIEEQAARIIAELANQIQAYPDELIGVLCPTNDEARTIWALIESSPVGPRAILQIENQHSAFDPEKSICVTTIHSAKGLEFRAVHLACAGSVTKFKSYQKHVAYTAVTRAKTSLRVYSNGSMPGYLEQALAAVQPLPDLPKISDLFGNK